MLSLVWESPCGSKAKDRFVTRINAKNAAKLLGVSTRKLYKWRREGLLPATVNAPAKPLEWNEVELRRWFKARQRRKNAKPTAGPPRPPANDRLKNIEARVLYNCHAVGALANALIGLTASMQEIDGKGADVIARLDARHRSTDARLAVAGGNESRHVLGGGDLIWQLQQRVKKVEASNQELRRACAAALACLKVVGRIMCKSSAGDAEQLRKPLSEIHRLSQTLARVSRNVGGEHELHRGPLKPSQSCRFLSGSSEG